MTKGKRRQPGLPAVLLLNRIGKEWRTSVPAAVVNRVEEILAPLKKRSMDFGRSFSHWRTMPDKDLTLGLFGADRPDSFFHAPSLDWSIRLTEPDITKTIAKLLSSGPANYRSRNIHAFLQALGVEASFLEGDLDRCEVAAERPVVKKSTGNGGRFDLWFHWQKDDEERLVVIEAKLNADLTPIQLRDYHNAKEVVRLRNGGAHRLIVLGLHPNIMSKVSRETRLWYFCSWRDLLLKYERLRPEGARLTDLIYLNTLWHRTGALTRKAGDARI